MNPRNIKASIIIGALVLVPSVSLAASNPSITFDNGWYKLVQSRHTQKGVLRGRVLIGPSCPNVTFPPTQECSPKPYQTILSVKTEDGSQEVTQMRSGKKGTFQLVLSAGTYLIGPVQETIIINGMEQITNFMPFASPQKVTILPGQITQVTITFDSGIR